MTTSRPLSAPILARRAPSWASASSGRGSARSVLGRRARPGASALSVVIALSLAAGCRPGTGSVELQGTVTVSEERDEPAGYCEDTPAQPGLAPLEGADAALNGAEERTDEDGWYALTVLGPPGFDDDLSINVDHPDYEPYERDVDVTFCRRADDKFFNIQLVPRGSSAR